MLLCRLTRKYQYHRQIPLIEDSHDKPNDIQKETSVQEITTCVGSSTSPEQEKESSIHFLRSISECLNTVKLTLFSIERSVKKVAESKVNKPMNNCNTVKLEWTLVSSVLDRIFICFYLIAIAVSLGLFLPRP